MKPLGVGHVIAIGLALVFFTIPLAVLTTGGLLYIPVVIASIDTLYEVGVLALSVALPILVLLAAVAVMGAFAVVGTLIERVESRVRKGRG